MGLAETFDNTTEAILKPMDIVKRIDNFPETVVITFDRKMFRHLINDGLTEIIERLGSDGEIPIYKIEYKNKPVAFYTSWSGGPATVGFLEEVIAMGGKKILLFGSCGSLDRDISDGYVIVPTHAYRDEGTSYHYMAADEGDFIEIKTAGRIMEVLKELQVPVVSGKTWTTDAIYRETYMNKERRKKAGCIAVEMECASVMALAKFKDIDIYQFLYTADNLDCGQWEARLLGNIPEDMQERYVRIAFEVAVRL